MIYRDPFNYVYLHFNLGFYQNKTFSSLLHISAYNKKGPDVHFFPQWQFYMA